MRERAKDGRAKFSVDVKLIRLSEALIEDGLLGAWDGDDREKVAAALQRMVEAWIAYTIGPDVTP